MLVSIFVALCALALLRLGKWVALDTNVYQHTVITIIIITIAVIS